MADRPCPPAERSHTFASNLAEAEMNRLILVAVTGAAASGIAAAPALAGLSHNPSFSHQLPGRVPSGAQTVKVADENHRGKPSASPSAVPSANGQRDAHD